MLQKRPDLIFHLRTRLFGESSISPYVHLCWIGLPFLARAHTLSDSLEGPVATVNKDLYHTICPNISSENREIIKYFRRRFIQYALVICWHSSDHESDAMWRLYAAEAGVAIKIQCQSLAASITDDETDYTGKSNYVDYGSSFIPESKALSAFLHRMNRFDHEQEFGVLTSDLTKETNWLGDARKIATITVRLTGTLDHEVVVSPLAQEWFVELIQSISRQYTLEAPVKRSSKAARPVWG